MEHRITSVDDPNICSICLGLGSGQPDSPVYCKYDYIFPKIDALKQSSEVFGCQTCHLLWDALRTNISPMGEAELQEQAHISWRPGKPLEVIYSPAPHDDAITLDLFARDADLLQAYRMLGPALEIEPDSSAASNLAIASQWLEECLTKHEGDKAHLLCEPFRPVSLPTRLIDVGSSAHGAREPFLVETNGELGSYVALSYCWGDPDIHPPFKTTKQTIEQHKAAIPTSSMPATLRDAIFITIYLGFRYIWIDALCIIQDDPEDWTFEAEHMDKVYSNATLSIIEDRGEGSSSGIFGSQSLGDAPQELKLNGRSIYVNNNTERGHHRGIITEPISDESEPINRRAWTMQEATLSKRTLRYPGPEMLWSCSSFFACACRRNEPHSEIGTRARLTQYSERELDYQFIERRPHILEEDLREKWHSTVSGFTQRAIRYEGDLLPALAGMAKLFQLRFEKLRSRRGNYVAGMWEGALHWDLLWQTWDSTDCDQNQEARMASARPRQWRAPSWSWASISGPVKFEYRGPEFFGAEILRIDLHPLSKNSPYGQLREDASLTLRGPVVHGLSGRQKRWHADRGDGVIVKYVKSEVTDRQGGTYPVAWDHWESVQHQEGDVYSCLKIDHRILPAACEHYLILKKLAGKTNSFERVGVNLWAAPGPLFENAVVETITIR